MPDTAVARRALVLLDLTSLNDSDDESTIAQLCSRAVTDYGKAAAVCIWPRFVPLCKKWLKNSGVRIATVANFPHGRDDIDCARAETAAAIAYGADEVDLVFPYRCWLDGEKNQAHDLVASCKEICGQDILLKVILETGCLETSQNISRASVDAIKAGADFLKTSTGKTEVSATLAAAAAMLSAIQASARSVGFKASGGIRTCEDAEEYLKLAASIMGDAWISPRTFRFGASGLLNDLLATLGQAVTSTSKATEHY